MTQQVGLHLPLADEAGEVFAWLDEKPSLSRHVGAVRRLDALHDRRPELFSTTALLVVRNFTIEPIEPLIKVAAYRAGVHLDVGYSGYDPAADEGLDALLGAQPDVVIVMLRLEELTPALTADFLGTGHDAAADLADGAVEQVVSLTRRIRAASRAGVLVHNFAGPLSPAGGLADSQDPGGQLNQVRRMNLRLAEEISGVDGAHVLDVDHVFARLGLSQCYDDRGGRVSDAPLSQPALRALAEAQVRHIKALRGPAVRCVVVDCDNTLWGGVVGEEGGGGIVLGGTGAGLRYRALQQNLLDLRRRGIVLAICSKNEREDVLDVLRTHPECLLHEDDFAATRINWDDKATNISSIATELNLGLEHILFIDDNPIECEWVTTRLPALQVIQWSVADRDDTPLRDLALFDSLVVTEEDRSRTEMYHSEARRRTVRHGVTSIDDYLRTLEMVAVVGSGKAEHLQRLAQLTQKTNQFNLTTRRHDLAALERMLQDPCTRVLWLELRDRFGASGVVGCGIVRRHGEEALIDTLLLSCRVIGRRAEDVIVNRMAILARDMGAAVLVGEYIPTQRNTQVATLYSRLGFDGPEDGAEGQLWRWSLAAGIPPRPDWFEIVDADDGGA